MNILHVIWSLEFGGIERLVLDLCIAQRKFGHQARIIAGHAKGGMAPQFTNEKIPVCDAGLRGGLDQGWFKGKYIKDEFRRADIIHIHTYSPTLIRWAKKSGSPMIFTDHGNYGLGRRHSWRDKLKFILQSYFLEHHAHYMTFNSHFTKSLAEQHFSLERIPNKVVYNGIYQNHTTTAKSLDLHSLPANLDDNFIVGTTSRFAGFKCINRLIDAFALMRNRENCRLLLVGDGPLRGSYEKLVKAHGISDLVLFTGFRSNVRDYQQAMDVCIFPSCGEPFGLVAVETLALGKPTIVMQDGGGITEIIEPLEPADVVSNVDNLAFRLEHYQNLWEKDMLINPTQIAARKERAKCFDINVMTNEFNNVYLQCLESLKK